MATIKEILEVDFYVDPRRMTKENEKVISDYIKADKLKRKNKALLRISSADKIVPKKGTGR